DLVGGDKAVNRVGRATCAVVRSKDAREAPLQLVQPLVAPRAPSSFGRGCVPAAPRLAAPDSAGDAADKGTGLLAPWTARPIDLQDQVRELRLERIRYDDTKLLEQRERSLQLRNASLGVGEVL